MNARLIASENCSEKSSVTDTQLKLGNRNAVDNFRFVLSNDASFAASLLLFAI